MSDLTIGPGFEGPSFEFYDGSSTETSLTPIPYTVNLAGHDYAIDLSKYQRQGLDSIRNRVGSGTEPSDELFDAGGSWWRYRYDWRHGAGQHNADLDQGADPQRFQQSWRINPWGLQGMELQHSTSKCVGDASWLTQPNVMLASTATHLYVANGVGLWRTTDLVTYVACTGWTGVVAAITRDGVDAYIATSTGIFHFGPASAAALGTLGVGGSYDNIRFVGNRLLCAYGNRLAEVLATSLVDIIVHYQPGFVWTTIFSIGSKIYAGGFAGNRSELYTLNTLPSTGVLVQGQEAAPFGTGELLRYGLGTTGVAVLCTSLGVRMATLSGDGTLTYGPLIAEAGDCRTVCAEGRFAWFGWQTQDGGRTGLGRMALDTFVEAQLPAYASDLSTVATNPVTASARFKGTTVFGVANLGVFCEQPGYELDGWYDSGCIYFGTVEDKILTALRVRFEPLAANETISAKILNQRGDVVVTSDASVRGDVSVDVNLNAVRLDKCQVILSLSGDGTTSPYIRLWRIRAYPVPPPNERWLVPLLLGSRVIMSDGEGQAMSMDPLAEVQYLTDLWRTKTPILYYEGAASYRVRIDNYQLVPRQWSDDSRFFECTFLVQLISV